MERHLVRMDWLKQYYFTIHTTQSDLRIQCQNDSYVLLRARNNCENFGVYNKAPQIIKAIRSRNKEVIILAGFNIPKLY